MLRNVEKINKETISGIFIIALVSLFIFSKFLFGFSLALYLPLMLMSFFITYLYPRSGLYAILFLTIVFERFFTLEPVILGITELKIYPLDFILLAILAKLINQLVLKREKINFQKSDFFLLSFLFLTLIYFLFSFFDSRGDTSLAFSTFKNYVFYATLYFVILHLFRKKKYIEQVFNFSLAGCVVVIGFLFFGIFQGEGLWTEFTPLSTQGTRILAFTHAFYFSMAILTLFSYMIYKSSRTFNWSYFLLIFWSIGLAGAMMRHLWISLAFTFMTIFVLYKERKIFAKIFSKYLLSIFVLIFIAYYASLVFLNSSFDHSFSYAGDVILNRAHSLVGNNYDESIAWRSLVWKEAFNEYMNNPLLGIGLGSHLSIEIGNYRDMVEIRNIHNSFLAILVQMGVVSFSFFIIWIFKILKATFQSKHRSWIGMALIALAVNYLIAFLFQPYLETNLLGIFFWIIFGLLRVIGYENVKTFDREITRL